MNLHLSPSSGVTSSLKQQLIVAALELDESGLRSQEPNVGVNDSLLSVTPRTYLVMTLDSFYSFCRSQIKTTKLLHFSMTPLSRGEDGGDRENTNGGGLTGM